MHINPERSDRPDYDLLVRQVTSILEGERDLTANASQFSALVYDTIADLNWAGFYFTVPSKKGEGNDLLVGPFQGKPACARIPFGRGVCGATAVQRETIVVADVHARQDKPTSKTADLRYFRVDQIDGMFARFRDNFALCVAA